MAAWSHYYSKMVEEADPNEPIKVLTYGTSKTSRYVIIGDEASIPARNNLRGQPHQLLLWKAR
jgi:hypothetical protein